jgi:hypothetical protein
MHPDCFLTVVDQAALFAFVRPLKATSESSEALKSLILRLERVYKPVRDVQNDGGGECRSSQFESWLQQWGTRHRTTPADTHMSDGLIERFHGTLLPRVRAVIHSRNIPRASWSEVLQAVVYVLNRTAHQGKRPDPVRAIPFSQDYVLKAFELSWSNMLLHCAWSPLKA